MSLPEMMITAGKSRIERLYNFQKFDSGRLKSILETDRIYLSSPKLFNDPWDCRPCFDLSGLDDPAVYTRHVEWLGTGGQKSPAHINRLRNDRQFLEDHVRKVGIRIESEIQKRYRLYCLTPKPSNILMWSHYAQNHTGICLEFNSHRNLMSDSIKVVYLKAYPTLDLTDDDPDTMLAPLLTKAIDWEYEEEYRLIAQEESVAFNNETLLTRDNLLQLPSDTLISVIVGCAAPHHMSRL